MASLLAIAAPAEAQSLFDVLGGIFGGGQPAPRPQPQQPRPQPQAQPAPSGNNWSGLARIGAWRLQKTEWTDADEAGYSNFVRAIGRSGCSTVDSCIRSKANPYRDSDPTPEQYKFWSDCADWPYFLRSYYAWKNGLPMVYSTRMTSLPLTEEQKKAIAEGKEKEQTDVRYSWNGNRPAGRVRLPDPNSGVSNFFQIHEQLQNSVHTATFRVDPRTDYGDMYTPAVRPGAIRPGTAVYDPSGHVGVVYDITADGQVMVFDALIDRKSISPRRPYSTDYYKRSKIAHGGWFQNFRRVYVADARYDVFSGTYSGGSTYLAANQDIPDYSIEMFGNTKTSDGSNAYKLADGKVTTSFQEFLRRRMFKGTYKINVIPEFKVRLGAICDDFGSRVSLVQDATTKGVARKPHIEVLPNTIYGGSGDWDLYSTPGGDVRRRNSVNAALTAAKELKGMIDRGSPDYGYDGNDLKGDMIAAARETLKSCSITYMNSINQPVKLTLESLLKRMPYMSFSPWHCIELRWGATSDSELASCADLNDSDKMRWYRAQQTMRNQMSRDTNLFTGYSLEEVERRASQLGPAKAENFDLIGRMQKEL